MMSGLFQSKPDPYRDVPQSQRFRRQSESGDADAGEKTPERKPTVLHTLDT
jgi:hypothetical protein